MANTGHFAHRRLLKAAVFQPVSAAVGGEHAGEGASACAVPDRREPGGRRLAGSSAGVLYRAVTGRILDVSPHFIVIGPPGGEAGDGAVDETAEGTQRFALTADATAWRGAPLEPAALRHGDEAVVRLMPARPGVADRVWANIGRVSGIIDACEDDRVLVAGGATRAAQTVVIPRHAASKIRVRFPSMQPGYLIDVIGLRRRGVLEGLVPATSQPPYRGDRVVPAAHQGDRLPEAITGCAVWHDPGDEPYGVLGVSYPALDPATGCVEDAALAGAGQPRQPPAYREMPYLAVGSALQVRNECTGLSCTLPVTGCAPIARLFNDRCHACRASPRGRVADLTLASFVALGGELENGCFNATLRIGR